MIEPAGPDQLVALGLCVGVQVAVVFLSVVIANAYGERSLLVHAGSALMAILAIYCLVGGLPHLAEGALLLVLALAGVQLRDLVNHAGALRNPRRWLIGVSGVLLPVLALANAALGWHLLLPGVAAWTAVVVVMMLRAWPQSQPWATWLVPGHVLLVLGSAWLGWRSLDHEPDPALPLALVLAAWSLAIYLATVWRSRIFSETRVRIDARNTVDPLTGLSTPLVFYERVQAVRSLIKRYGHPSVLLLVHIENLGPLAAEFGPEVGESAVLVAANRIRQSLGEGDVAARLSHSRIAVLCEGVGLAEGTANLASRILVAGLKEPLPSAPTEFLQFRIVLALVPVNDMTSRALVQRMGAQMDSQLLHPGERRISAMSADELA
ncbi:MAG: diguanylate cyclase [Burkholderiales bacterium]|nr:diguanylate cyclase [Burkholderiales bacterium]